MDVYRYSREDLIRILRVNPRQLVAWEKAGLLVSAESYTFFDLLQVKKVRDLCARRVRPVEIRQSVAAMRKQAAGMENPLIEASTFMAGRHRVAFRHDGILLEPIAGQFMFDFSGNEKVVASVPVNRGSSATIVRITKLRKSITGARLRLIPGMRLLILISATCLMKPDGLPKLSEHILGRCSWRQPMPMPTTTSRSLTKR